MYGLLDEVGQLQYGQVFVQYSVDVLKPCERTRVVTGMFSTPVLFLLNNRRRLAPAEHTRNENERN